MAKKIKEWRRLFGLERKKTFGQKLMDKKGLLLSGLAVAVLFTLRNVKIGRK
jgi:hypothetical protein